MDRPIPSKTSLREQMRRFRRSVDDVPARSATIWAQVQQHPAVLTARTVMVFTSVSGEPDTVPFVAWCRESGKVVVLPEDDPDPSAVDAVVVPGLAFTSAGDRLGRGGGWYDRFLPWLRPDAVTIGVGFAEQLVAELPVEPHDVRLDAVVTDR